MKVTFVLESADLAGGVRVVAEHARQLMRRGHEVTVVSTPNPVLPLRLRLSHLYRKHEWPRPGEIIASHLDNTGVPHYRIDRYRPVRASDVPDADVVVATTWRTGHWIHELPPSKGVHVHLMQHYEVWAGWDAKEGCPAAWRLPSHKVVISRWLEKLCREEFGQRCALVPNAVDTTLFHAPEREKSINGLGGVVGMLYHDLAFKGVDVTVRAIERVRERLGADVVKLVAFGREEPDGEVKLPEGTHYERRPAQERLRELYGMCDVWVCGSRAEGFHLPPLEAMACRTPVVSTAVGGPVDIIDEGVNGHLVEVEDVEALARRVMRVLGLPSRVWKEMSEAAYRTARAYSWDDAAELLERALVRAVAEGPASVGPASVGVAREGAARA